MIIFYIYDIYQIQRIDLGGEIVLFNVLFNFAVGIKSWKYIFWGPAIMKIKKKSPEWATVPDMLIFQNPWTMSGVKKHF